MEQGAKKNIIRLLSMLFIMVLFFTCSPYVYGAYSPVYTNEAVRLNRLGLFLGTGNGFDLDKSCDRLQGAVMFVRLLGEEESALSEPKPSPFTDVSQSWAIPYVGQMYHSGYSNGISQTSYGTGEMSGNQFAAYILRSLGYSEEEGDFIWSSALSTLLNLGILSKGDYDTISNGCFYRDYAVKLASNALDARLKNSDKTLLESLVDKNAIAEPGELRPLPVSSGTKVRTYEDMVNVFQRMHANLQYSTTLDTSGLTLTTVKNWLNLIAGTASSDVWGWSIVSTYSTDKNYPLNVSVKWLYSDGYEVAYSYLYPNSAIGLSDKNQEIKVVVDSVLESEIKDGMTEREKIKAVHDYLVKYTEYDLELANNTMTNSLNTSDSYKAYGVLVKHMGVCDGYAKAFNLFMDILAIPSERVVGSSYFNNRSVNHAWNRVYMDGEYLNIDVTWDDPVPDGGNLVRYDYFLVTDKHLDTDHDWDSSQFNVTYY